jgi:alkaline phosphatase D
MRFAVTSCSDPLEHSKQKVWASIAQAMPDHLILLGDQIYMDYGPKIVSIFWNNPANGEPAAFSDLDFAAHQYERYAAQWRSMQGSGLWQLPKLKVHGIWDDHDFAWNNSFGAGPIDDRQPKNGQPVPASKQQISRHLFRQFFSSLRAPIYPANTLQTQNAIDQLNEDLRRRVFFSDMLPADAEHGLVELRDGVNLMLTDGRTFRTAQQESVSTSSMFGDEQMKWVQGNIKDGAITLIAAGCTLSHGPERWKKYKDHDELLNVLSERKDARVLLLSGDIHYTAVEESEAPNLIEVIASGAARPFGNWLPWRASRGNFALCDIAPEAVRVEMREGEPGSWNASQRVATIDRNSWRVQR